MNKESLFFFFILFLFALVSLTQSQSVESCEPDWNKPCPKKCCAAKLAFAKKCWDNFKDVNELVERHLQAIKNGDYQNNLQLAKNEFASEGNNKHMHTAPMPMSFQFSTHTIILFKNWETSNPVTYYISLIVCFIFGVISVMLKVLRLYIERSLAKTYKVNVFTSRTLLKNNTIRMMLSFIIYSWDYLLMLIVMTFNFGLFLAVVLGLSFGFFLFGNHFVVNKRCIVNNVDAHKQFNGDPACCGC